MTDVSGGSSLIFRAIFRMLGAEHPIRLTCGIATGVALKMIVDTAAVLYPTLTKLAAYDVYWFMIVAAPIFYAPIAFGRGGAPESVANQINAIAAIMKRANLSKEQEAHFWRALLERYVAEATNDPSSRPKVADIAAKVVNEIAPPAGQPDAPA
jgi:hypothetical protein